MLNFSDQKGMWVPRQIELNLRLLSVGTLVMAYLYIYSEVSCLPLHLQILNEDCYSNMFATC